MTLEIFLTLVITFYYLLSFGFMAVEFDVEEEDSLGWVFLIVFYNLVMCMFLFPFFLGIKIAKKLK